MWCDSLVKATQMNGIDAVNTVTIDYMQAWIQKGIGLAIWIVKWSILVVSYVVVVHL